MINSQHVPVYDGHQKEEYVLFENDFSAGLEGWSGLLDTGINYYPGLHTASLTGPFSMLVDTRGGAANVEAVASKRMAAYRGVWKINFRIAWNASLGGVGNNSLDKWRMSLDWQGGDDGVSRKWFELQYLHYSEGTSSNFIRWRLSDGNAASMNTITEISETTALDGTGLEMGFNQINKYDFFDIELRFIANAEDSKWLTLKINGKSYDISSYDLSNIQTAAGDFDNGANLLFYCENRASNSSADPYLLVDYVRVALEDYE
jgi:hypothetical protein